jgi:hypothetical protein
MKIMFPYRMATTTDGTHAILLITWKVKNMYSMGPSLTPKQKHVSCGVWMYANKLLTKWVSEKTVTGDKTWLYHQDPVSEILSIEEESDS